MKTFRMPTLLLALAALAGCASGPEEGTPTTEEDLAQFDSMQKELEKKREVFRTGTAQDFSVAGNTLFYVEAAQGNPRLHSFDKGTGQTTDYSFPVHLATPTAPNPTDTINYSVSTSMIASMNVADGANTYALGAAQEKLGKLTLPAPPMGQRWWAYSVSGSDLYVVLLENGQYHLKKWTPGAAQLVEVLVLDTLIAPNEMGEFHNFAISGSTLIFDEGGRIWIAGLSDAKAKWAKNDRRVGGADFYPGGVVYSQGKELYRYDAASDSRESLNEKIRSGYTLNKTFADAHMPGSDLTWCKHRNKIIYKADDGLFSYDLDTKKVKPLLLDARDNSVIYRNPIALEDGTLFVKGLLSKSGAVGADGPTYKVSPENLD